MLKRVLIIGLGLVVMILTVAIIFGGPGTPHPMGSIVDPFNSVDFSDLPQLSRFTARDGTKLAYRSYTSATSAPSQGSVVLIHGSSATSSSMHPMAKELSAAGFATYALVNAKSMHCSVSFTRISLPVDAVEARDERAHEVVLQIAEQHAHRAQHRGLARHDLQRDLDLVADLARVDRPGAAGGDERELARVPAALDRHLAHALRHVVAGDAVHAGSRLFDRQPHRAGDVRVWADPAVDSVRLGWESFRMLLIKEDRLTKLTDAKTGVAGLKDFFSEIDSFAEPVESYTVTGDFWDEEGHDDPVAIEQLGRSPFSALCL